MSDKEHISIINKGVETWNLWRRRNPSILPSLIGVDLREKDLSEAELCFAHLGEARLNGTTLKKAEFSRAILHKADLSGADLSEATLAGADLSNSVLTRANLRGAYLKEAILIGADLQGADLANASLVGANLTRAKLKGANWTNVSLRETILAEADLNEVEGIETCRHVGPSIVDYRTLVCSHPLPLEFLRGCGLPDELIKFLPSFRSDPIQFHSCFISYAEEDRSFAYRLYADLQNKGVRCWFAPEHMKAGDKIRDRLDESIRTHDKLLLVLSRHSVASKWVEKEVEAAFEKEKGKKTVLVPIRVDDAVEKSKSGWAADIKRARHIGDFRNWTSHDNYENAFERLLRDLKADGVNKGVKQKKRKLNTLADLSWGRKDAVETRARLASFEEDWNAPGMEAYDEL